MPMCHVSSWCKEVVIPDKNGKPLGGLSCVDVCNGQIGPPGYKKWTAQAPRPGDFAAAPAGVLRFADDGVVVELTRDDVMVIVAAAREVGWV